MTVRIERGSLLIADLSGYTHYMASIDLRAIHVVSELLDSVASALAPYEVAKLEGDAVFCHSLEGRVSGDETLQLVTDAYARFLAHAGRISNESGCSCPACHMLPGLGLKFVLHHGEYAIHNVAGSAELVGPDVILAHRLLKNTVGAQWGRRDYLLLTEQWARCVGVDVASLSGDQHSEAYEHIGTVDCFVLNLESTDGEVATLTPRQASGPASACTYVRPDNDPAHGSPTPVLFRRP